MTDEPTSEALVPAEIVDLGWAPSTDSARRWRARRSQLRRTAHDRRDASWGVVRRSQIFERASLVSSPETSGNGDTRWNGPFASCLVSRTTRHGDASGETESVIHTIFEGTSEIQQLVIARAISGLRIE